MIYYSYFYFFNFIFILIKALSAIYYIFNAVQGLNWLHKNAWGVVKKRRSGLCAWSAVASKAVVIVVVGVVDTVSPTTAKHII